MQLLEDFDRCYRIMSTRDARFDGWLIVGVHSTGIYCRPSCPAAPPKPRNVEFFPTAATAQRAGLRACKRCRPDASPGSPEWDARGDVVARAMRLIDDGVVDRSGVAGLARALGYSERHLNRVLVDAVGVGPISLARAQRAQVARILIETTDLPFTQVASAAGFGSIRQFNDTVKAVLATSPRDLRARTRRGDHPVEPGVLSLRLPVRAPFAAAPLLTFFAGRAIAGVELVSAETATLTRSLRLPRGTGLVDLTLHGDHVAARLQLTDLRDLQAATHRCRRLLDPDADPQAVSDHLGGDPLLGPLVRATPGLRVPGSVDPFETLVRAIVGQQVSVAAARTVLGRIVASCGSTHGIATSGPEALFPTPEQIAGLDPAVLSMPTARARCLVGAAAAVASGELMLGPGADRDVTRAALLEVPGIGPWTADYVLLRGLGDPDVLLASDLGVRHALAALPGGDARSASELAHAWSPWGSYATQLLWNSLA